MKIMKVILLCFILSFIKTDLKESNKNDRAKSYTQKIKNVADQINSTVQDSEDLNFDYPEQINQVTALFRVELMRQTNKVFHYNIDKDSTKCVMNLAYYISDTNAPTRTVVPAMINFYNPDNSVMTNFQVSNQVSEPKKDTLFLNKEGKYTFVLTNPSKYEMILDLVLSLTDCHKIEHKLHKKDMITFSNRLQKTFMQQTMAMNENLSTRYKVKNILKKDIEGTHRKLYYGTLLECLVIIVLSYFREQADHLNLINIQNNIQRKVKQLQ